MSASAPALFSVGSANLRTPAPLTPVPLPRFARAGGRPPLTAIDRLSTADDGAAFAKLANVWSLDTLIDPRLTVEPVAVFKLVRPLVALAAVVALPFVSVYFNMTGPT